MRYNRAARIIQVYLRRGAIKKWAEAGERRKRSRAAVVIQTRIRRRFGPNGTYLIMAGIFANTVVLSMDRYPMTVDEEETIGVANSVFTYFFIGEMVLKLYALTPKYYAKDPYNLFDAFIVIASFVSLVSSLRS